MINALQIVLGCFVVAFLLFFFVRRLCVNTENRNVATYIALQSPSVRNAANAFEQRIALATREAAKGFRVCAGCGFENPLSRPSCVLCGVVAPKKASAFDGLRRKTGQIPVETVQTESNRQRRIRRRREWTRRVGADGFVVWHHDDKPSDNADSTLPSYVMIPREKEEEPSIISNQTSEVEDEATAAETDSIEITIDKALDDSTSTVATLARVAQSLEKRLETTTISPVRSGDPVSMVGALDSVRVANLDFPTKLAHFINTMAVLFRETTQEGNSREAPVSRFHIVRELLLSDSMEALANLSAAQARGAIRVDFVGEQGIDAGGVYREWVQYINQAIVAPEAGIFTCVNAQEHAFYLNSNAREILGEDYWAHFLAAGRLLGRALLEGNVTGFHLAQPLLKIILGLPVSLDDLEYYDPEIYKNLKWLLDNEGVDALCLDFTATEKLPSGETRTVELMAGGCEMDVTDANKLEYVDLKLNYLLFESVSSQLRAFLRGVYEVVPLELLMVFDAEELDLVLSGSDEIDVDDWETHTLAYTDPNAGYHREFNLALLPCYDHFWKAVRELSVDQRRRLLQFTTGSTRPPPGGFGSLTSYDGRLSLFTLRGVPTHLTRGYLQSHACFNRLDLPMHSGYAAMRDAVLAAISGDMDGFTID